MYFGRKEGVVEEVKELSDEREGGRRVDGVHEVGDEWTCKREPVAAAIESHTRTRKEVAGAQSPHVSITFEERELQTLPTDVPSIRSFLPYSSSLPFPSFPHHIHQSQYHFFSVRLSLG